MATTVNALLETLGDQIGDADEGMVHGKAAELELTIGTRDFTIRQSPGVLQSSRQGGTTGAALWECSVRFADWLGSARNPLFIRDVLGSESRALELGAGVSGLVPLMLGPRVKQVVATDQQYALHVLQSNLNANVRLSRKSRKHASDLAVDIEALALDWETDDVARTLRSHGLSHAFDAVLACDCVFNYALIDSFVGACVEACTFARTNEDGVAGRKAPAVCLVAQQLRQPDVFRQWLGVFVKVFRVWRLPDTMLTDKLRADSGFVVHLCILR